MTIKPANHEQRTLANAFGVSKIRIREIEKKLSLFKGEHTRDSVLFEKLASICDTPEELMVLSVIIGRRQGKVDGCFEQFRSICEN